MEYEGDLTGASGYLEDDECNDVYAYDDYVEDID